MYLIDKELLGNWFFIVGSYFISWLVGCWLVIYFLNRSFVSLIGRLLNWIGFIG